MAHTALSQLSLSLPCNVVRIPTPQVLLLFSLPLFFFWLPDGVGLVADATLTQWSFYVSRQAVWPVDWTGLPVPVG